YCYRDTFNATPTHLFIHQTKLKDDEPLSGVVLNRVEQEYDLLLAKQKIKKELVDCQLKYREVCQLNGNLKAENAKLQQRLQTNEIDANSTEKALLQGELNETRQKLIESSQLSERLKTEILRERNEKE